MTLAEVHNAIAVTYQAYYSGYNEYIGRGRGRYLSLRNMFHQTSEIMKYLHSLIAPSQCLEYVYINGIRGLLVLQMYIFLLEESWKSINLSLPDLVVYGTWY